MTKCLKKGAKIDAHNLDYIEAHSKNVTTGDSKLTL